MTNNNNNNLPGRLRAYAEINATLGHYTEAKCMNEAADEIERLRKELEETKRRLPTKSAIDICRELVKR